MTDPHLLTENRADPMDSPDANSPGDADDYAPLQGEVLMFNVLRRSDDQTLGPMPQEDLLEMLRVGEVERTDLVYFEGSPGWEPIEEVFEIHEQLRHFVDDGQDRMVVADSYREVSEVLASGEEIFYIAVQEKSGFLSRQKNSIILTGRRLLLLHRRRGGMELEGYPWTEVTNTLMRDDGGSLGTFSFLVGLEKRVDLPHIPLQQVRRLFQLSQELRQ